MQPGPIGPEELDDFIRAVGTAFHDTTSAEDLERIRDIHEPGRELVVRDGGAIVATAATVSLELTVPGATLPAAGVTAVGVRATHRRRGLAGALLRRQLEDLREREGAEAVAFLWASEARIYGRFGYGRAAEIGELSVRTSRTELRRELRPEGMSADLHLDLAGAVGDLRAVYDAVLPGRPGLIARSDARWRAVLRDPESRRDGARPKRVVVVRGPEGRAEGYAIYAAKGIVGLEDGTVVVQEALGSTPRGHRAVWHHVLELDLTSKLEWLVAPSDEEVLWALTDSREAQFKPTDGIWLRVVDPARALAARRYAREVDLVLDLEDRVLAQNAGRLRLATAADGTATCEPTSAAADLRLDAEALGTVFLGGPSLRALADAGRVQELTPGAVDAATTALRSPRAPWCPDIF